WQNLISHRTNVDPLELLPQEHNFRMHAMNQRQVTIASLNELGHVGDVIVNVRSGKIVNGHLRVELAIAENQRTVPVTYLDCDLATEQIILAFFDAVGAKAITDAERLRATLGQITTTSQHLQASLDDWVLSFTPTKGTGRDSEELDEPEEDFLDAPVLGTAPSASPAARSAPLVEEATASTAPEVALPVPEGLQATAPGAEAPVPAPIVAPVVAAPLALVADAVEPVIDPAPADPPSLEVPAPAPVSTPLVVVVEDDQIAAALIADARAALLEEAQAAQAADAPASPAAALIADARAALLEEAQAAQAADAPALLAAATAPTSYLVKVGEYDQQIPAAQFAPWFAALCAQVGNGQSQLSAEVRRRLGFG
ncbi:MAG: hypothetical protein WCJ55_20385, partial [Chloroflexales bacterium]